MEIALEFSESELEDLVTEVVDNLDVVVDDEEIVEMVSSFERFLEESDDDAIKYDLMESHIVRMLKG